MVCAIAFALGPRRRDVRVAVQFEARTAVDARRSWGPCSESSGPTTSTWQRTTMSSMPRSGARSSRRGALPKFWKKRGPRARAGDRPDEPSAATGCRDSHERPARPGDDPLQCRPSRRRAGGVSDRPRAPAADRRLHLPALGALLQPTPDDPSGFTPPRAPDFYRFVLAHPAVSVALMAPDGPAELAENLSALDDWRELAAEEFAAIAAHGKRVRRHAGQFP